VPRPFRLNADEYRPLGGTGLRVPPIVFGTSALGNLYQVISDVAKLEIAAAWFDHVAPPVVLDSAGKYGAGLALEQIGRVLTKLDVPPEQVILSNKLAWKRAPLTTPEPTFEPGLWIDVEHDAVQRINYDGMLECWAEGCRLLGGAYRPQLVSVHDPDEYLAAAMSPDDRQRRFADVVDAYRALAELKQRGEVRGIGVGAKDWRVIEAIDAAVALDWVMLAACYTLLRHPPELVAFMKRLADRGVGIINSAVFHAGFLVGGKYFDYRVLDPNSDADRKLLAWRKGFAALCQGHGITPMHACVQFALSGPGVVAVALNTSHADRVAQNVAATVTPVPAQFWASMEEEGLLGENDPTP
jgi:D-threo-aldose 1-dehydrogenase